MENLNDSKGINTFSEDVKGNIKTSDKDSLGLYELKQQKQWFDEECWQFLDQMKQDKMRWLEDINKNNVDNLTNVRREASRYFSNKKEEYL